MIPPISDDQVIDLANLYAGDPLNAAKPLDAYLRDACYYIYGFACNLKAGDSYDLARAKFEAASNLDGYYSPNPSGMLTDNQIINLSTRWIQAYTNIGRLQHQSNVENARDEMYWVIVYARYRDTGYDDESAIEQMENGMYQEAGLPIPYPSTLPQPPTRAQLCGGKTVFQGMVAHTQEYGTFNTFGPEINSLHIESDRKEWYNDHLEAGATVLELALTWNYDEPGYHHPVPGTDWTQDLGALGDLIIEALSYVSPDAKRFCGIWLFMGGDGESAPKNPDGSYPYNDPQGKTYGWQWLIDNSARIVSFLQNYKGYDLTKYILFMPGYDGCVPGWAGQYNEWTRVNSWLILQRNLVGPNGYIGLELSAGYPNWSGEGVSDYSTLAGQGLDVILIETTCPIGPGNMPVPNDFCNASDDARKPFDCVWQIFSRLLGPLYIRPNDQPSCDDHSVHSSLPSTPRGQFFVHAYEYRTYDWVRGNCTVAQIQADRVYLFTLGIKYVH